MIGFAVGLVAAMAVLAPFTLAWRVRALQAEAENRGLELSNRWLENKCRLLAATVAQYEAETGH